MIGDAARATSAPPLGPGDRVAHYVVDASVAQGSMGQIYRAHHADTGAAVALKILHAAVARDPVAVERFRREHETASSLVHPNIVRVYEFGETADGSYFIAMEYLEGEELGAVLARQGPMQPVRMLPILCQLALGLHHAHREGVIHRDLKPANIYLCRDGTRDDVRILDFGSVKLQLDAGPKLTTLGTTLGSPYYMSPEQAMGMLDVDPRSDVFALGAITHELCTASVAFGAESTAEILKRVTSEEPEPISTLNHDYPWGFDTVVKRAVRKDKADRFPTTLAFAEAALEAFGLRPDVGHYASTRAENIHVVKMTRSSVPAAPPRSVANDPSVLPLPERTMGAAAKLGVAALLLAMAAAVVWWFAT